MGMEHCWNDRQGKTSTGGDTRPSATLYTTNLTRTDL